jgi:DNA-binding response OmpR family regulator
MLPQATTDFKGGKVMLVGADPKQILEKRFNAAGWQVVKATNEQAAIEHARREPVETAVLVSSHSLTDVAETIFNLRDLNNSIEIIILLDHHGRQANRFLRQLLEHPIEGTRIVTRRQLQTRLRALLPQAPPGGP